MPTSGAVPRAVRIAEEHRVLCDAAGACWETLDTHAEARAFPPPPQQHTWGQWLGGKLDALFDSTGRAVDRAKSAAAGVAREGVEGLHAAQDMVVHDVVEPVTHAVAASVDRAKSVAQDALIAAQDKAARGVHVAQDALAAAQERGVHVAQDAIAAAQHGAHTAADRVMDTVHAVQDKLHSVQERARSTASGAAEKVKESAHSAFEQVRATAHDKADSVGHIRNQTTGALIRPAQSAADAVRDSVDRMRSAIAQIQDEAYLFRDGQKQQQQQLQLQFSNVMLQPRVGMQFGYDYHQSDLLRIATHARAVAQDAADLHALAAHAMLSGQQMLQQQRLAMSQAQPIQQPQPNVVNTPVAPAPAQKAGPVRVIPVFAPTSVPVAPVPSRRMILVQQQQSIAAPWLTLLWTLPLLLTAGLAWMRMVRARRAVGVSPAQAERELNKYIRVAHYPGAQTYGTTTGPAATVGVGEPVPRTMTVVVPAPLRMLVVELRTLRPLASSVLPMCLAGVLEMARMRPLAVHVLNATLVAAVLSATATERDIARRDSATQALLGSSDGKVTVQEEGRAEEIEAPHHPRRIVPVHHAQPEPRIHALKHVYHAVQDPQSVRAVAMRVRDAAVAAEISLLAYRIWALTTAPSNVLTSM